MNERKKIPYGITDFQLIQEENYYYVDKTGYIPKIEAAGRYLSLIRPRRFGKSLLLVTLECYYDLAARDEFDTLFKGTGIHARPTPEKNAYLILKFNFSAVNPVPDRVEQSFNSHAKTELFFFGKKYRDLLDDDYFEMMAQYEHAYEKVEFLLEYVGAIGRRVYLLIDEYDNFANTILASYGQKHYHELTHGAGFFRLFFNVLKKGTTAKGSGLGRLFITGVSPVTLDDVTSGFNIGRNISLEPAFNELLGFTEKELHQIIEYYRAHGLSIPNPDEFFTLMREWYDNYLFAEDATEKVFNTDMALYFIQEVLESGKYPKDMLDQNIKIDYGKLRHLIILGRKLNGNFLRLEKILEQGEVESDVQKSFPVESLTNPENFVSLLFYFGLLSYAGPRRLVIPNHTVKTLMFSYLRDAFEDGQVFRLNLWHFVNLVHAMAYKGDWEEVFRFLANEIQQQSSIRDYLDGEKVVQTFLLAYLNVTELYLIRSEEEMGKGFADIYLAPFLPKYPDIQYAYVIELKYLKRDEKSDEQIHKALEEAEVQLRRYAGDERILRKTDGPETVFLALIFCGWELKIAQQIEIT